MIDQRFVDRSRQFLTVTYLPKIEAAVARLPDDEIWWRPNQASNAIGHLLLHLAGNVRQWIVSGLGGAPVSRQRHLEFAPEDTPAKADLLADLSRAVAEADAVLARLDLTTRAGPGRPATPEVQFQRQDSAAGDTASTEHVGRSIWISGRSAKNPNQRAPQPFEASRWTPARSMVGWIDQRTPTRSSAEPHWGRIDTSGCRTSV